MRFHRSSITEKEVRYVQEALQSERLSGDGAFTKKVQSLLQEKFALPGVLLTSSATDALELGALLSGIAPGDEVILPSFTFSSTVNAFLLRGAVPVFCDIREDTYTIDERLIEELITERTRAIVSVDYAGMPCDADRLNAIAQAHGLMYISDAAQSIGSMYKGRSTGSTAPICVYSFHETKNITMGEGGAIVIQDPLLYEKAKVLREKGTNRSAFFEGKTEQYSWQSVGSSFLPSDILAALLLAQLERFDALQKVRLARWEQYHEELEALELEGKLLRPVVPSYASHNGHIYNILLPKGVERGKVIELLQDEGIPSRICFVPLHDTDFSRKSGWYRSLPITEDISQRLLRLPLHSEMSQEDVKTVCQAIRRICDNMV